MPSPSGISRVIVVVLDGLRPDAIVRFGLPRLGALLDTTAHTLTGRTVEPSTTASVLASLFTGVRPAVHGIRNEHGMLPSLVKRLTPLPRLLGRYRQPMFGYMRALPFGFRTIGTTLAARLGVRARFEGHDAESILAAARPGLDRTRRGVIYLHWPDADDAGHAHGWMSEGYAQAVRRLDESVGRVLDATGVLHDPETVIMFMADHGGGGTVADDHESDHPDDVTIPIVIGGGQVEPNLLPTGSSPLDVCATIPWLFGIVPPPDWQGSPLRSAFHPAGRREIRQVEVAA
ncbi:MAG: alkaline phosphatase [Gemmatimonadales bacterium]|nr:alkaline phosphatase [Gemmatimonadales bacterium]